MINYEAQNYKLFVDYALILLKFTLAGDKSFLKSFTPSPSEEKRNKEEDAEDPETDTRTLGFFGLAVFGHAVVRFVLRIDKPALAGCRRWRRQTMCRAGSGFQRLPARFSVQKRLRKAVPSACRQGSLSGHGFQGF